MFSLSSYRLNVTAYLSSLGKFIVACLMIIGRLGPITISIALFKNRKEKNENLLAYPKGNVIVG